MAERGEMQSVGLHLVAKVKKSSQPPSSSSSSSSSSFFFFFFFFPPFLPSIRWKKRRKVFSSSFSIYYRGKAIFLSIFNITATTRPTTARKKKTVSLESTAQTSIYDFDFLFGIIWPIFHLLLLLYLCVFIYFFFFCSGWPTFRNVRTGGIVWKRRKRATATPSIGSGGKRRRLPRPRRQSTSPKRFISTESEFVRRACGVRAIVIAITFDNIVFEIASVDFCLPWVTEMYLLPVFLLEEGIALQMVAIGFSFFSSF